jgi:hypothetical protein
MKAEIAQFSAGIDIDPSLGDAKAYRMTAKATILPKRIIYCSAEK